jgi:hypothetical protein
MMSFAFVNLKHAKISIILAGDTSVLPAGAAGH